MILALSFGRRACAKHAIVVSQNFGRLTKPNLRNVIWECMYQDVNSHAKRGGIDHKCMVITESTVILFYRDLGQEVRSYQLITGDLTRTKLGPYQISSTYKSFH